MGDLRRHAFEPVSNGLRVTKRCRVGRAFTLVELLVIIAILAVLIMLLMPTLYKAMRFARLASCAANMRGVYTALVVYAGDNKNFVPTVGGYTRGTGDGWCSLGGKYGEKYWFGALAQARAFDNLQLLVCPGTTSWGGSDLVKGSNLYKNIGTNAKPNYVLRQAAELDSFNGTFWGNYGLRWSGWWHKIYPNGRLMMAEAVCEFGFPMFNQMDLHGGTFAGTEYNIGMAISRVGEASMNVLGSDGRVIRLLNYADFASWKWDKCAFGTYVIPGAVGVTVPEDMPYYYPCNTRTGDVWVAGQYGFSDPYYTNQHHLGPVPPPCHRSYLPMSDLPWDFWSTFDKELFNGSALPWGNGIWWPSTWQNP